MLLLVSLKPMKLQFAKAMALLWITSTYSIHLYSQTGGPEFLQCQDTLIRLCLQDEGVRLPANNQIYLGENDSTATSCSVHVTQKSKVKVTCGTTLQYEVLFFQNDTSASQILQPLTTLSVDSSGEVELVFDTETSPDSGINSAGISYTEGSEEYHHVQWVVTDSCGDSSVCEQFLDIYDCHPPSSTAQNEVFQRVIPLGCFLTMFAKDFDQSSTDDCTTRQKLLRSFDPDSYTPSYTIVGCAPAYGVEVPWKIWIADGGHDANGNGNIEWNERNKSEHDFSIIFSDASGACCEPEDPVISGRVTLPNSDQGIKDVAVTLSEPGHVYPTYITGVDGVYTFNVAETGMEKTISCARNDHPKNGVSTLDLVKIQKHLLGRDTLDSPYLLIAADANNSQNVSAIDLIELRKLVLGVYTQLPSNTSWRFIRADYVFQDPQDPWDATWPPDDAATITITDISNPGNLDFYGIKIGDVNGTAQPNATALFPRQPLPAFALEAEQQSYQHGDLLYIPIRVADALSLSGFQFTITTTGMEILDILPGSIDISEEDYALFGDRCTMSWFDVNSVELSKADIAFTVVTKAKETGTLDRSLSINSDITDAELYLNESDIFRPVLHVDQQDEIDKIQIHSIAPNPWKQETNIEFFLPESDQVTFTVFGVSGGILQSTTHYLSSGYHQHQLKSSDIPERGVLILEITTAKQSVFQTMMLLE